MSSKRRSPSWTPPIASSGRDGRSPTAAWSGCSGPLEECWKPAFARYLIPKYTALRHDLKRYVSYYNSDRARTGRLTQGRTLEEVLGKAKMWSGTSEDASLHL